MSFREDMKRMEIESSGVWPEGAPSYPARTGAELERLREDRKHLLAMVRKLVYEVHGASTLHAMDGGPRVDTTWFEQRIERLWEEAKRP